MPISRLTLPLRVSGLLAAAAVLLAPEWGLAVAGERPPLLALVGGDAGLCLELHEGRALRERVENSEWLRRVRESELFQSWRRSDPARRLAQSVAGLEKAVEQAVDQFLLGLFGEQALLALYPRAGAQPAALLMTVADAPETLDRALDVWNRSEGAETRTRRRRDAEYVERTRPARSGQSAGTLFYYRDGPLLALSEKEDLVQTLVDRIASGAGNGLAENADLKSVWPDPPRGGGLRLAVQPQLWIQAQPAATPAAEKPIAEKAGGDKAGAPEWLRSWQRCSLVAVEARFEEGWIVTASARFPADSASPRWTRFVERSRGPSPLLDRVPGDALAVCWTRLDLSDAGSLLNELIPAEKRKDWARLRQVARGLLLGLDLPNDVLPSLGPGMAAWIAPRPAGDAAAGLPWEAAALWALKVDANPPRPEEARDAPQRVRPPVAAALDNALGTGLNVLAAVQNANDADGAAIVQSDAIGAARVRWIEGLPHWAPAIGTAEDAVVLASGPGGARRVLSERPPAPLSRQPAFRAVGERCVSEPNFAVAVDLAGVRQTLRVQRGLLVRYAARNGLSPGEAARRLDDLSDLFGLLDDLFVAARFDAAEVRMTLGGTVRVPEQP